MTETAELLRFLARPELERLWGDVRDRLERLGDARGTVRLSGAGDEERRAVADLLGLGTLPREDLRIRSLGMCTPGRPDRRPPWTTRAISESPVRSMISTSIAPSPKLSRSPTTTSRSRSS